MRAKFLKTRDSGGVGSYIDFKTDWATLTFEPWSNEDGGGAATWQANAHSNLPSQTGANQKEFTKREKPQLKRASEKPKATVKSDSDDEETKSASSVIRGIKGKSNKPHQKKIKLL